MVLEILAGAIRQLKDIQGIQNRKEEVKLSLVADDMIVFINDPKNSTRKSLYEISTLSEMVGYNINFKKIGSLPIIK